MESRQDFKCLERLLRVNKNAASHYVNVICNVVCDVRGVSFLTCQFSIFIMNTCVFLRSMLMGVWVFDCISLWKLGGTCLVVLNLCLFFQSHCFEQSVNLGTIILTNCFCLTRLEARTKESNACVSSWDVKLCGAWGLTLTSYQISRLGLTPQPPNFVVAALTCQWVLKRGAKR